MNIAEYVYLPPPIQPAPYPAPARPADEAAVVGAMLVETEFVSRRRARIECLSIRRLAARRGGSR